MKPQWRWKRYLEKIKSLRIPVSRYYHSESVDPQTVPFGLTQWVLGRQHYHVHRFELAEVPEAHRSAALRLQLQQWSPFPDFQFRDLWLEGQVTVFCWDSATVQGVMNDQGLNPSRVRVIPETLLRAPLEDGLRLAACMEGFEGQFWRNGALEASRYWRDLPGRHAWLLFQQDLGLNQPEMLLNVPDPAHPAFLEKPWTTSRRMGRWPENGFRDERLIYLCIMLLLVPATSWQMSSFLKAEWANERLEAQLDQLKQDLDPVAKARGRALQAIARIQRLRLMDPYPSQLELLAWFSEHLLKKGDRLMEWDYQAGGKLKVVLETALEAKTANLAEILHQGPWFEAIRVSSGNKPNRVLLEMMVEPFSFDAPKEPHA